MSRRMSSVKPLPKLKPEEVVNKWRIIRELGSGTFGAVYEVTNINTNETGAMKVESRSQDKMSRTLKSEIAVMIELNNERVRNVCTVMGSGKTESFTYMVMTLVGPSFDKIVENREVSKAKMNTGKMSLFTALYCCLHGLQALEDVHRVGYVHRDVKPQNFTIGPLSCRSSIYLIDFGTARKYLGKNGQHHRPRARCGFRGTVHYASSNALRGEEQSRRDDIWSWLYILIRLTSGTLPWLTLKSLKDYYADLEQYASAKDSAVENKQFLNGCPTGYKDIIETIKPLTYYSAPDYMVITNIMKSMMAACYANGKPPLLDWEMSPTTAA